MDELVKIIMGCIVSSLITGITMNFAFDKRLALLTAEFRSMREMFAMQLEAVKSGLNDLASKISRHDEDIRRLDRAEHNGGFQPNGNHGKR